MFELSDYLTGIYKITDYTRSLTICNRQADQYDVLAQRVPDSLVANPPNTQAIFEMLRQEFVDDTQALETTIVELTASQRAHRDGEASDIADVTIPESPNASELMDVET